MTKRRTPRAKVALEIQLKPPLGSPPFHIMEVCRDVCGLCGISRTQIINEAADFCPVIVAANGAAQIAWKRVLDEAQT